MSTTLPVSTQANPPLDPARQAARRQRAQFLNNLIIRVISLTLFLGVWQVAGEHVSDVLFTTPWKVALAGARMIASGELMAYLLPSLVVLAYGLVISAVLGIISGLLLARFRVLDIALGPYVTFLYATPMVALVPVIVLWAGYGTFAKVIILILFAYFPVVINTHQGVRNIDPHLLEVGRSFRCSERQVWWNIVLPGALPYIVTGLRLAVGRGLIGMVLADLYTAISGIGYLIVRSASTYQIDQMFVPVVTVGFLGVVLSAALQALERRIAPWAGQRHE